MPIDLSMSCPPHVQEDPVVHVVESSRRRSPLSRVPTRLGPAETNRVGTGEGNELSIIKAHPSKYFPKVHCSRLGPALVRVGQPAVWRYLIPARTIVQRSRIGFLRGRGLFRGHRLGFS